ncbi:MAG: DUF72 domain-containing protein [Opitutus sp.]
MAIHIGCGSWTDDVYTGVLYPRGLPPAQRLATYATWFDHIEVNSTYYAAPKEKVTASWAKQTPGGFKFQIKLHRAFSQNPQRAAEGDGVQRLLRGVAPLIRENKLAAFLLVPSPSFTPDRHRLEELDALTKKLWPHPLAVELRDCGWVQGKQKAQTLEYFRSHGLVWVAVDMPVIKGASLMPYVGEATRGDLAYVRLHGRNPRYTTAKSAAERHDYEYDARALADVVAKLKKLSRKTGELYVVANNHAHDFAPKTALALQRALGLRARVKEAAKRA